MELTDKMGVIRALVEHKEDIKDFGELKAYIDRLHSEESRPEGVWVGIDQEPHEEWECSNCGNIINTYMQDELEEHNYCHKCGAKMSTPWADMRGEE